MARKQRPSHLDDPPAVSSSTEEEEETFSDDDEGEQEEEEGGGEQEEEEEEEEVEEEEGEQSSSEEEEEEAAAAKTESLPSTPPVKPHPSSSGPMEPESTPVKATQARSTRSSTVKSKKRPNSETETTLLKSKRVKKEPKSQGGGGEEKKLFQRLWSDDNEIELLKGMLDYRAMHHSDPAANAAAFYEFVKKSLHVEVTKAQLVDKMKRLRKKYRNNAGRGKKGKDPTFSKPHDRKTYELSKTIWGCADGVSVSVSVPGRCLNGMLSFNKDVVVLDETLIKTGLELIGEQKRLELEERWRRVELAELQMYVTRAELIRDQASLILEAYKGR